MADERKPIKRSKQLVTLSKEHHELLLFTWKIRQGIRNGTPFTIIAKFVQWFWQDMLEKHMQKEDLILAPFLPADHPLAAKMMEEHQETEACVRVIESITDKAMFELLAETIETNVRFEERQLFPFAEKIVSPEDLDKIQQKLSALNAVRSNWENEFWL
ncbi:MAG TPA: hemerythrin domain-containing protein [Flavisolibacter sp.]|nr:hemerythrin domain-containing protein [Flavisolibacter sp.]